MLSQQAIVNNAMEFLSTSSVNMRSNADSSTSDLKCSVSFDKLLSRTKDCSSKSSLADVTNQKVDKLSNTSGKKVNKTREAVGKLMSNNTKSSQLNRASQSLKSQTSSPGEKVASTLNNVKKEVMNTLDLTEEELTAMMQMSGLGLMDLLNPDTLKTLVLNQADITDPSLLLTEDGLGQQLHQLLSNVNDIVNAANISTDDIASIKDDSDELQKLMNFMDESFKMVSEDDTATKQVPMTTLDELNGAKENSKENDTKEMPEESKIQFTVIKEDSSIETSNSSMNSNTGQSENNEYKTETTMTNQFLDQMINANANVNEASFSENLREIHELRDIANQIIDQIKLTIKPTQTSMDVTLNPEHLGKVALNITTKNGLLTASFTTQNEVAKEAIESQMQVLKDNLSNQGIKVEAIEVTVSDFHFRQESNMSQESNQQHKGSSNNKRSFRMDVGEDFVTGQQEENVERTTIDAGNNIDYSA